MLTWLGAALAFSLSMIIFSTIVSALTEAIHRVLHLREAGLQHMLDQLFAQAVGDPGKRKVFVEKLTRNLAVGDATGKMQGFAHWFASRHVSTLHWRELLRRVVENDAAGAILSDKSGAALAALAVRYERFGVDATAFFQERARAISILLAFVAAFALNVDAVALFSSFLKDRALTERVIANAKPILEAYEKSRGSGEQAERAAQDAEAVETSIAELRETLESPLLAGLPIGAGYYPWCAQLKLDGRCEGVAAARQGYDELGDVRRVFRVLGDEARLIFLWLLSILLSGFLIGLGGPFWFDAYRTLASIVGGAAGPSQRAAALQKSPDTSTLPASSPPGLLADPKAILEQVDPAPKEPR